jgi:hypothetical protein
VKVIFDQGTPVPLRRHLPGHDVATAYEMGWSELTNGELLAAAEAGGFGAIVTTDKNLRHQQNLTGRVFGVLVLPTTNWRAIHRNVARVAEALEALLPGSVHEVAFEE